MKLTNTQRWLLRLGSMVGLLFFVSTFLWIFFDYAWWVRPKTAEDMRGCMIMFYHLFSSIGGLVCTSILLTESSDGKT